MLVGIRPRDSSEAFKFFNMYLKGAQLYGWNQVLDTVTGTQYPILNLVMKQAKKGSVRYSEVDLDSSLATPLEAGELLKNVIPFLDCKTAFNKYIAEYNDSLGINKDSPTPTVGLPE